MYMNHLFKDGNITPPFMGIGGISEILKMLQTMFSDMESLVLPIVRLCVKFQQKKLTTSCYFGGPKCKSSGNTVGGGWGFVGLKFFAGCHQI